MFTLLWCQRDLRIAGNAALNWAIAQGHPVIAIYIHSPEEDKPWREGAASRWWLHNSLNNFSKQLQETGIKLYYFKGNSVDIIKQIVSSLPVCAASWTARHEPARRHCESVIQINLEKNDITCHIARDEILQTPENFLTASKQTPYRVFTPFYKRLRGEMELGGSFVHDKLKPIKPGNTPTINGSLPLQKLNLLDDHCWHEKLKQYWTPGEVAAHARLQQFIESILEGYIVDRDIPAIDGTSQLSAHLTFGEISPSQVVNTLLPAINSANSSTSKAAESFLRQLVWREFARYTLWHFPHTHDESMNQKFKRQFWRRDKKILKRWQQGKTGIAIIDAAMQQLWETGWMHNRMRMLVASLLTKNLGIDWRDGANWFWDTLVDADLANNTMGWQWVAGCGVDAAPYFRIFNPETQAKRFDPDLSYINRWRNVSIPQQTPPLVDLVNSRKDALLRYKML